MSTTWDKCFKKIKKYTKKIITRSCLKMSSFFKKLMTKEKKSRHFRLRLDKTKKELKIFKREVALMVMHSWKKFRDRIWTSKISWSRSMSMKLKTMSSWVTNMLWMITSKCNINSNTIPWMVKCQWMTCNNRKWMKWVDLMEIWTWMACNKNRCSKKCKKLKLNSNLLRNLNLLLMHLQPKHFQKLLPNNLQLIFHKLKDHQLVTWKVINLQSDELN